MEVLTGAGLASAAGLNAWVPLVLVGVLARFTDLVPLPAGWEWLTDPWALGLFTALLVVEVAADKVPGLDHLNDVLQTAVRPAAGGIVVGAGTGSSVLVQDPSTWVASDDWVPLALGAALALGVHLLKAGARLALNAVTAGVGAPFASTAEDAASVLLVLVALLAPLLVVVVLAALAAALVAVARRRRSRRLA